MEPTSKSSRSSLLGPIPLLVCATLLVWALPAVFTQLPALLGFDHPDKWFLDSYAVLASSDAVRAGINPDLPNPLDILHRPHSYSNWWFGLGSLGLTRQDNFAVGLVWVAVFLAVAILILRPRTYRDAALALAFLGSPVVLLTVIRANNDLVVFALIGAAALLLRRDTTVRIALAALLVALAAGLKFYPLVAGLFVILIRPGKRLCFCLLGVGALLTAVLIDVGSTISRGTFGLSTDIHKTGLPVLLTDLGFAGRTPQAIGAGLIGLAGFMLARRGITSGLADADAGKRQAFLLGAVLLAACFVAGVSHAYRWVFVVLLLPWLIGRLADSSSRRVAIAALALLLLVCWGDGLLCLTLNWLWTTRTVESVAHLERVWRFVTQPLHWILVALLAGWLWDAVFAAVRAIQPAQRV
ncbi:MAG TPA: hypothetical protein VHD32_07630 [Candidatus Didemnitutus sp.]|nr:hypothetical protein [Candidatus Didemnitutus sp.]